MEKSFLLSAFNSALGVNLNKELLLEQSLVHVKRIKKKVKEKVKGENFDLENNTGIKTKLKNTKNERISTLLQLKHIAPNFNPILVKIFHVKIIFENYINNGILYHDLNITRY